MIAATVSATTVGGGATGGSTPTRPAPLSQVAGVARPAGHAGQTATLDAVQIASLTAQRAAAPSPRQVATELLHRFGWKRYQFRFLNPLWSRESSWEVHARNPYSGAYGIPQAVPGSKMAAAGPHWRTSARTQILWGLAYIKARYGSPRHAWEHERETGWY